MITDHFLAEIAQLKGEISLAEEGLANYAQENAQLNSHCADLSRQHHVALDEIERLRRRVWALTTLLHPYHIPREAVEGDI
jgi:hypothetical protein